MEKERKLILGNGEAHFPGRFMWYSMPAFNSICQVCRGWWQGMFYSADERAQLSVALAISDAEKTMAVKQITFSYFHLQVFPPWPPHHTCLTSRAIQDEWQILCVWKTVLFLFLFLRGRTEPKPHETTTKDTFPGWKTKSRTNAQQQQGKITAKLNRWKHHNIRA